MGAKKSTKKFATSEKKNVLLPIKSILFFRCCRRRRFHCTLVVVPEWSV